MTQNPKFFAGIFFFKLAWNVICKKGNRIKKKEADTIQKRSLHGILPSIFPNMKPPQKNCEWKAYDEDGKAKASIVEMVM